jgi:predicted ATPase/class 3 adenylate cyclase/DNA-binding CsgD family transcriptional regulator
MSDNPGRTVLAPLYISEPASGRGSGGFVLPTGTVTFLMTDIEGSTRAWQASAEALSVAVPRHYQILDDAISAHGGVRPVEQGEGDSVVGAFARPSDALAAAIAAQRMLREEVWPGSISLRVRMAVHTGEAQLRDEGNYFGLTVIRCARIRSCGYGGQVLVSDATAAVVGPNLTDGARLVDLGWHRLKDLGRPERIWQVEHADVETGFAPLKSLDAYRHNLPLQLSPLIGRHAEVDAVVHLLAEERMVTLTGSGGVGKTRLALAVGAELVGDHAGGVWFVELAGVRGPESVALATVRALGTVEAPGVGPAELVAAELGETDRSVIVLDNCEHVLDDCATFALTLLRANPMASVLTTSREPLGVPGEVAFRVPSLSCPPHGEPVVVEALSQFDAVNLFVDRARRARPSFAVTEANAAAIAQVCHRLDGIPLAVELAAARCRHLSPERIAVELDDRFHLLNGGSRVVMPRQQTLAASVDWSFELLDDAERRVMRRLGVFTGPFSLEAAESIVASPADIDPVEVFDAVSRLVDKSLVISDDSVAPRYRLLETIRVFALARARDAGELDTLRHAHAVAWRDAMHGFTGPTDDVVAMLDDYHDDAVAALAWASEHDVELGLQLLRPLARGFQGSGHSGDAVPVFERFLDPEIEHRYPQEWVRAWSAAVLPLGAHRGWEQLEAVLHRCETLAARLDDTYCLAVIRWLLHMDLATDRVLLEQARIHHQPYTEALAAVRLAIDVLQAEPDLAPSALAAAEAIATAYNSRYVRDFLLSARGDHALAYGDLATAVAAGSQLTTSLPWLVQANGCDLLVEAGLLSRDESALETAVACAQRLAGRHVTLAAPLLVSSTTASALLGGRPRTDDARVASGTSGWYGLRGWLAVRDAVDCGDLEAAASYAQLHLADGPRHQAIGHAFQGLAHRIEGDWHEALRIAAQYGFRPLVVDALEGLGAIAADQDSSAEALRLLGAADRLRRETGYAWRFPTEQQTFDSASARAEHDLGDRAQSAWEQGQELDWRDAVAYAQRARGERARPRRGWKSLTATEQHVLTLVAQGLTNRQIGERLFITAGTVKTHLENIFAKTGYHNRTELAAAAARRHEPPGGE